MTTTHTCAICGLKFADGLGFKDIDGVYRHWSSLACLEAQAHEIARLREQVRRFVEFTAMFRGWPDDPATTEEADHVA